MTKKEDKVPIGLIILIVIAIIVIIIIFIATLGNASLGDSQDIPPECKDTKEQAKRRHGKLLLLIQKQEALKIKLDKLFKRMYFAVRLGLVIFWFSILYGFYHFGLVKDLSDFLNYSEASILTLIVLNFLTFGSVTNLKNYIDIIKTKTENIIYGKYISIDEKIKLNKAEEEKLKKKLEE